ncbi:MAG: RHS repeat-associated core domain-containing protein [Verrucomicrobiota bacterium]|nr:RHS repeat-associated core domain-containing protein [Verrucomicrobiota bacterium]
MITIVDFLKKSVLVVLLLSQVAAVVNAQFVEPWQKWAQQPATAPLLVRARIMGADLTPVTFNLAEKSEDFDGEGCGVTATVTNLFRATLRPHQPYTLTISGAELEQVDLSLQGFVNDHLSRLSKKLAYPYLVYVDGVLTNAISHNFGSCGNHSKTWEIEIRPDRGFRPVSWRGIEENWRRDEDNVSPNRVIGDAMMPDIGPGKDTSATNTEIRWSVYLGKLWNGQSAGLIKFAERNLASNSFTENTLWYSQPSTNRSEVDVIQTGAGSLRQVKVPHGFLDISSTNGVMDLKFYHLVNVSSSTNTNGIYTILTNSPFVTWKIMNPDGTNQWKAMNFVEERAAWTNIYAISYSSTNTSWTLASGSGADARTEKRTLNISGPSRAETVEIHGGTNLTYKAIENYHKFAWGWELTNVVTNPGSNGLTNSWEYFTDSNDDFYQQLKLYRKPDGGWERWTYDAYNQNHTGNAKLTPWKDSPANPDDATDENAWHTFMWQSDEGYGVAHNQTSETFGGTNLDSQVIYHKWGREDWVSETGREIRTETMSSPLEAGKSTRVRAWTPNGDNLSDLTLDVSHEDERRAFYYYDFGGYDVATETFLTNNAATGLKRTVINSSWNSAGGVYGQSGEYDAPIDFLLSTREEHFFTNGLPIRKNTYVYKGLNETLDALIIQPLEYRKLTYDSLGHLTNETVIDPNNSNHVRVVYSASWRDAAGKDANRLLFEIGESGARKNYFYDSLGRVTNITVVGVGVVDGFASQSDVVATLRYDALNRTLSHVTTSSSLSLTNLTSYDTAGRVTSMTGVDGLTTNIAYTVGSSTRTELLPGGRSNVFMFYLDGRPKSVTGNAQVSQFFDYSTVGGELEVEWDWDHAKNVSHVTYGNESALRWMEQVTGLGRQLKQERAPSLYADQTNITHYTWWLGQIESIDKPPIETATGSQDISVLYQYDGYGNVYVEREFAVGNRDKVFETLYETDGTNWFRVTTNSIAGISGPLNVKKERLTGFTATNVLSDVLEIDREGNETRTITYVDLTNKKVTSITTNSASALSATNIVINGRLMQAGSTTVATPSYFTYDALGRQLSEKNSLGFTRTNAYDAFGRVTVEKDFTGQRTEYSYYPNTHASAGLLYCKTNAKGKKTYYEYSLRGELVRTWGDEVYPEERVYDQFGDLTELHTYQGGSGWAGTNWPATVGTTNITRWTYHEPTGLLLSKTDAVGNSVTNNYFTNNMLWTKTWSRVAAGITNRLTITNVYFGHGDLERQDYSDGTPSTFYTFWDAEGKPGAVVHDGTQTTFTYDAQGRTTYEEIDWESDAVQDVVLNRNYDPVYGLTNITLTVGTNAPLQVFYGYDSQGRMSRVTNGASVTAYSYLTNSDLVSMIQFSHSNSLVLTSAKSWEYGSRLKSIQHSTASGLVDDVSYSYDALNRRERALKQDGSQWRFGYNDRNEVVKGKRYWEDFMPVAGQQFEYAYDTIGNRSSAKVGGDEHGANLRTISYGVNALNQYTNVVTPMKVEIIGAAKATASVSVNGSTNLDRRVEYFRKELDISGTNAVHQAVTIIASEGAGSVTNELPAGITVPPLTVSPTYDADGNLLGDGLWHYKWDGENRLLQMTNTTTLASSARQKLEFKYDQMGRRKLKSVYYWNSTNWFSNPSEQTYFVYDGWLLLAELNTLSGALLRSHTWGLDMSGSREGAAGIGGLLMTSHHGSTNVTNAFVCFEGNGNVKALVRQDGTVVARYEHGPFGEVIRQSGAWAEANPITFSTKYRDHQTGLFYYGYRYYSPTLGRWISRDPIEEGDGNLLYGFVRNNPGSFWDPTGLSVGEVVASTGIRAGLMGAVVSVTVGKFAAPAGSYSWQQAGKDAAMGFLGGWVGGFAAKGASAFLPQAGSVGFKRGAAASAVFGASVGELTLLAVNYDLDRLKTTAGKAQFVATIMFAGAVSAGGAHLIEESVDNLLFDVVLELGATVGVGVANGVWSVGEDAQAIIRPYVNEIEQKAK